jgi:hypothetical protein
LPDFSKQDPRWPSKAHFEPTIAAFDKQVPRCQAWVAGRSRQCKKPALKGFDVCRSCGGAGARARKTITSRKAFQEVLAGEDSHQVYTLIDKLHEIAKQGNLDAIKYILDQIFGTPKATVVNEIADRDLFAHIVRVTANFLKGDEFKEWLQQSKQALGESDSTS